MSTTDGKTEDRGDNIDESAAAKAAEESAKAEAEKKAAEDAEAARVAELAAAKDDKNKDGEKDEKGKGGIPLARHKEILERERAAREAVEARLAQYQKGEDIAVVNRDLAEAEAHVLKLEEQYDKLLTEGKTAEATALRRQIREADRIIADKKVELRTTAAEARAYEKARYDTTVERVEAAYPQLNPDSDEFDEGKAQRVMRIAQSFQYEGLTPAKALQEAVKTLFGEPASKDEKTAVEVTARVTEAEAAKAAREEAARVKAAEAAGRQPASLAKAGTDSNKLGSSGLGKVDVMKMSQEDFASLATKDPETLARLRGDLIEA